MKHPVVFITERGERHQRMAARAAPDCLEVTMLRHPSREELMRHLATAQYLISERSGTIDAEIIAAAPQLQLIQRLGSLWYDIDLEAARQVGVAVCYWPVIGSIRVAEHAMLQLLALTKQLRQAEAIALAASPQWGESRRTDEDTFAFNWSGRQGVEGLWRKTVGILGFGEIGTELARRLRGWECRVLYHKRRPLPGGTEAELGIAYASRDELLRESDCLVNFLPYSEETDRSIGAEALARMKGGAYLTSCGSGSVIDERALAEAIRSGKLAGAALDTFEWEPIRLDNPLLELARQGYNLLLTPHVAAGSMARDAQWRRTDYANILSHLQGRPLEYRLV